MALTLDPTPAVGLMGGQTAAGAPQFASLYVGDLHPDVTEAMLYEIFNSVGPVASIRVCRANISRQSLGYGYVNFHAVADAERALDTLNYSQIKGRACRIMWSHRDPNLRKNGSGNVFVKNLDKNIDNKALYDTFSLFGNILSCKVSTDELGKSKGYGFVHYETSESANTAVERVNGMQIGEKSVFVGNFVKRQERDKPEITNFTNLYVKNFPNEWEEADVQKIFAPFGKITSLAIKVDKKGRKFAFVNMESPEEAKRSIEGLHCNTDYRTEEEVERTKDLPAVPDEYFKFYCQRAQLKVERSRDLMDKFKSNPDSPVAAAEPTPFLGVNLYVKNLHDDMSEKDLQQLFGQFGNVTSVAVMRDDKQHSKGFGFVSFKNSDDATKAVAEMHLKVIRGKPLYVGLAEKKGERAARLASRYKGGGGPMSGFNATMGGMGGGFNTGGFPGGFSDAQGGMKGGGKGFAPGMVGGDQSFGFGKGGPGGQMGFPPQMMFGPRPGMMMTPRPGMPMGMPMGYPGPGGMMPMGPGPMMGKGGPMPQMHQMRPPLNLAPGARPGGPMGGKLGGQQMMPPGKGGPMHTRPDEPLTASALAAAAPGTQKQMLGEKLFPRISRFQPELAGKITGMMLEMDNSELLLLLESDPQLKNKVDEAMVVLQTLKQAGAK
eukprot:GEMP01016622.1.p1 GENE.GEMP01016622.1~~GEMP01016622.1.p1  ORF type:complete len:661 (+),score=163.45 GEMP01016622.1:198-2180(+)